MNDKPPVSLTHRLMLDLIDMEDDATVAKFARKVIPGLIDDLEMDKANYVSLTREVVALRRKVADAKHDSTCPLFGSVDYHCTCWKAGGATTSAPRPDSTAYCGRGLCAKLEGHSGRCDV